LSCSSLLQASEQQWLLEERHVVVPRFVHGSGGVVHGVALLARCVRVRRAHRVAEPGEGESAALGSPHRRAVADEHVGRHHDAAALVVAHGRCVQPGAVAPARRRHVVVVLALVGGDHRARVVARALHVLAHRAPGRGALVVAPRVRVALHHLLPVLAPPVAVVKDVDIAQRLHDHPRLTHRPVAAGRRDHPLAVATVSPTASKYKHIYMKINSPAPTTQLELGRVNQQSWSGGHSPLLGVGFIVRKLQLVRAGQVTDLPRANAINLVVPEGPRRVLGRGHGRAGHRAERVHVRRRRGGRQGGASPRAALRLGVVVRALVHDLRDLPLRRPLHFLLGEAAGEAALVVAARVLAPLHLLLPVLAPVVAVVRRPPALLLAEAGSRRAVAAVPEHVSWLRRCRGDGRRGRLIKRCVDEVHGLVLLVAPGLLLVVVVVRIS
jgi:hypothetical protein